MARTDWQGGEPAGSVAANTIDTEITTNLKAILTLIDNREHILADGDADNGMHRPGAVGGCGKDTTTNIEGNSKMVDVDGNNVLGALAYDTVKECLSLCTTAGTSAVWSSAAPRIIHNATTAKVDIITQNWTTLVNIGELTPLIVGELMKFESCIYPNSVVGVGIQFRLRKTDATAATIQDGATPRRMNGDDTSTLMWWYAATETAETFEIQAKAVFATGDFDVHAYSTIVTVYPVM